MRVPSKKNIRSSLRIDNFADDPQKVTDQLRTIFENAADRAPLSESRANYYLKDIDKLIETHGVEPIWRDYQGGDIAALYCNTGETYEGTVLWDARTGNLRLTTWGDWVETEERARRKVA